jgi:hypothetical protein
LLERTDRIARIALMPPIVRQIRSDDQISLRSLTSQFPTPTPCPKDVFGCLFDAKLVDPTACVLVAENDGKLLGYVSGSSRTAFYVGGMTAWVDEIFVLPERRGQGVGRMLMDAFEAWAVRHDCRSAALATRGAAPFYEHLGYAPTASYFKKYLAGTNHL